MSGFVRSQLIGLLAISAIGCTVGSVKGSVDGKSLDVADGVLMNGEQFLGPFGAADAGVVVLTDTDNLCSTFSKGAPQDSTGLALVFFQTNENSEIAPLQPGEYKWNARGIFGPGEPNARSVFAQWITTDLACRRSTEHSFEASGGSVKLESIDLSTGGAAAGTFTLTFGGDTITGSFNVDKCGSSLPEDTTKVCQ